MAKCQRFSFQDGLTVVAPGALQTTSVVGETLSVGVVKFTAPGARELPVKEHAHGEEASLQIYGGCVISQGIIAILTLLSIGWFVSSKMRPAA